MRRRKRAGLLEVIDRTPAAVAQAPEARFGVDDRGEWRLPRRSGSCSTFVVGGTWTLYTRLWMALTPPEGTDPGYACVVGEQYDGRPRAIQRELFLLDECASPLLPRLLLDTAALKDIYWADRVFVDPRHERFFADVQRTRWGLCAYPQETEWPEPELRQLHPFFRSRDRVAAPCEPPYVPDDDWGHLMIEALMGMDGDRGIKLFRGHEHADVFHDEHVRTPHRAAAIAVMAMQTFDWDDRIEDVVAYDGYEQPEEVEQRETNEQEVLDQQIVGILAQAGDPEMQAAVMRGDHHLYEPQTEREDVRRRLTEEDLAWLR